MSMAAIEKSIKKHKDKNYTVDGTWLFFAEGKPIPASTIRSFEAKSGIVLPDDYRELLMAYGTLTYFGVEFLDFKHMKPIYRRSATQKTKPPAHFGVLPFAVVGEDDFTYVFTLKKGAGSAPGDLAVRPWIGTLKGEFVKGIAAQTFEEWFVDWADLMAKKARKKS